MIKLEEISRIFRINLRLLIHFEEENLFSPISIDPENNTKYYTNNLLHRLQKILLYQSHGLRLNEIREIIGLRFDNEDNEIKDNEEIIIQLIDIHTKRIQEESSTMWKSDELEELQQALSQINSLIYEEYEDCEENQ